MDIQYLVVLPMDIQYLVVLPMDIPVFDGLVSAAAQNHSNTAIWIIPYSQLNTLHSVNKTEDSSQRTKVQVEGCHILPHFPRSPSLHPSFPPSPYLPKKSPQSFLVPPHPFTLLPSPVFMSLQFHNLFPTIHAPEVNYIASTASNVVLCVWGRGREGRGEGGGEKRWSRGKFTSTQVCGYPCM